MDWIDRNQISRRNITKNQRRMIMGRIYNRRKKAAHDGGKGTPRSGDQIDPHLKTSEIIAAEFGVSASTVKRVVQQSAILEAHPEVQQAKGEGKSGAATECRSTRPRQGKV